jgi:hypothetical protein
MLSQRLAIVNRFPSDSAAKVSLPAQSQTVFRYRGLAARSFVRWNTLAPAGPRGGRSDTRRGGAVAAAEPRRGVAAASLDATECCACRQLAIALGSEAMRGS